MASDSKQGLGGLLPGGGEGDVVRLWNAREDEIHGSF